MPLAEAAIMVEGSPLGPTAIPARLCFGAHAGRYGRTREINDLKGIDWSARLWFRSGKVML